MLLGNPGAMLPPPVAFHYHSETISVRELIQRVVTQQVQTLQAQETCSDGEIRQILARQYLAEEEVNEQAVGGTIKMPSASVQNRHAPDIQREIQRALESFEQGRFFMSPLMHQWWIW